MAFALRELEAASIPVNFLLPFDGTPLTPPAHLTPEYCVRVLAMFRLVNPEAEIRIAAGRELYLRSLQPLALHAANSVFVEGYLNSKGGTTAQTLQMLADGGFRIVSDLDLADLVPAAESDHERRERLVQLNTVKDRSDLRPAVS